MQASQVSVSIGDQTTDPAFEAFAGANRGADVLTVTTYNLLAPVWVSPGIYPGQDPALLDPPTRRAATRKRLLMLAPDVAFLQEAQKTELDALLAEEDGALSAVYDLEFCPFPLTFWTNWLTETTNKEPRENGVGILLKRSRLQKLSAKHVPLDLDEWKRSLPEYALGARACLVWAKIGAPHDRTALLVASHLDADSSYRAQLQLTQLAKKVKEEASSDNCGLRPAVVIWGGDFNLEHRNPTLRTVTTPRAGGFAMASGNVRTPTVYSSFATVRVDHILVHVPPVPEGYPTTTVTPLDTFVPACPLGHLFAVLPLMTELQGLLACLSGQRGAAVRVATVALVLLLLPILLLTLLLPIIISATCQKGKLRARQAWSLKEWGSDHLPVTVALRLSST